MLKIKGIDKNKIAKAKKLLTPFYIFIVLITVYHVYFATRVIPGVYVGDVKLGGKTFSQAKAALEAKHNSLGSRNLALKHGETGFNINADELDLQYSVDGTVARVFEVGRTGNIAIDTKDKIAGLIKPLRIKAHYSIDSDSLSNTLATIKGEINSLPESARFAFEGENIVIIPEKTGSSVGGDELYELVVSSFDQMDFSEKSLVVSTVPADVVQSNLKNFEPQVKQIISSPITISYNETTWELDSQKILPFLTVSKGEKSKFELRMNDPVVEAYAELLAQDVNVAPRGRVTESADGRVTDFVITQEGKELDTKKFSNDFKNALFTESADNKSFELSMLTVSEADPKKYGIYALLGEGVSKYTGSAASRAHNLKLAAQRTDGVLVPPGQIYSFNRSVGDISGATGYQTAYVISNGRTVLGDGGGVCQTSTTLFRAVLNSGLPVVTRHPHAYRVVYYEIESPVGMDASIYQPSLDFQFKNDTPNYILVQMYNVDDTQTLGFKIYGTPDGREVQLTEPIVTNQTPPPETQYIDDETLDEGVVRQVDFAAWGATASFNRTVTRDGEVLHEDTFTTRYQPWRAVFLRGTKDKDD